MRFSIHIDAGYLYGALATRESGSSNRDAIDVDEAALLGDLVELAVQDSGASLLRVLWYDAGRNGLPDAAQRRIGMLPGVKLRMGRINPFGEQKGVDLRLGLDLMSMSITRAVGVAYVISGDDDLTEAVTDAQDQGLQVKLITVPTAAGHPQSVAANLQLTADGTLTIPIRSLDKYVARASRPERGTAIPADVPKLAPVLPVIPPKPLTGATRAPTVVPPALPRPVYTSTSGAVSSQDHLDHEDIAAVARSTLEVWITTASAEERQQLAAARPVIPSEIDRLLLTDLVNKTGVYDIPTWARYELRDQFWQAVTTHPTGT